MALSTIIKQTCKECGKIAVEKSKIPFTNAIVLECGHILIEQKLAGTDYSSIVSSDGRRLMPYQIEGVKFLEQADARALLGDEQGLGKTIEALALLKLHRDELTPCIIVCPTTVKLQWHHEIIRWCGVEGFLTQVISSGKEKAAPGFDIYVTTYDLLKDEKAFDYVKGNIKFIILDECQRVKNHLSGRSKAVQKIAKDIEHILPMSGTPIKNHAGEYFTVLNLIRPRLFPHYNRFIENECDSYNNGYGYKVGGLKNPEEFHEKTKDFILRRTKDEVLKDLPELFRKFQHVPLEGAFKQAYDKALQELFDVMDDEDDGDSNKAMMAKIAIMTKMREIVGFCKVDPTVEFVEEFLLSSNKKIVVFTHHKGATSLLIQKLNQSLTDGGWKGCLDMNSSLNGDQRAALALKFKENDDYRVMVASTLASGEGLNLQFCSDAVMMERQWNPANEEQAEARFHRFGQKNEVSVNYMIASETIDDYFTELVESKRAIVASTLDNKEIEWNQDSLMKELLDVLNAKGRKAWKL